MFLYGTIRTMFCTATFLCSFFLAVILSCIPFLWNTKGKLEEEGNHLQFGVYILATDTEVTANFAVVSQNYSVNHLFLLVSSQTKKKGTKLSCKLPLSFFSPSTLMGFPLFSFWCGREEGGAVSALMGEDNLYNFSILYGRSVLSSLCLSYVC